jgi:hypothetical protein
MNFTKVNIAFYSCKKDTIQFLKEKSKITSSDNKYLLEFIEMKDDKEIKNINYYTSVNKSNLNVSYQSFDKDTKKTLKVKIHKKKKKMIIFFRINKQSKSFIPWNINMLLPFRRGKYEVTNPENPKLIKL